MFRCLVVAVDFLPCSLRALSHALHLTRTTGGRIILLHVLEGSELEARRAQLQLIEAARHARRPPACVVEPEHPGGVAATILAVAEERHADVIVMGAHGQLQLALPRLGQVARGVLLHSTVPVQIVPQGPVLKISAAQRWCGEPDQDTTLP